MGQPRFWHHTWFYTLLLTALFTAALAGTKALSDQRLEQQRQHLLNRERELWQQRFTQTGRALSQRWQRLERAAGLPWLQRASPETRQQFIAGCGPAPSTCSARLRMPGSPCLLAPGPLLHTCVRQGSVAGR